MVAGFFRKVSVLAVAGLLVGVPGTARAEQQARVVYSIEFADPGEEHDPEPYGAVVLRLPGEDRLLWREGRAEDTPSRWRYPATGAAIQEVPFTEDEILQVCAFVGERDGDVDERLADGCLPYEGVHEPYVIDGSGGHVTVNLYGVGRAAGREVVPQKGFADCVDIAVANGADPLTAHDACDAAELTTCYRIFREAHGRQAWALEACQARVD
ncbi:hypothetical protein [Saccharothrix syringae]|uniref:Uncharacterized protein n=1 Tax=Saccharothrix syringae TaxID=103733 RepID=A0A5Q0H5I2_SACSY|nr:hypothetical protein [Saccharothrix syringae]QFZ21012.1 hypothetical protein EKG83_29770 [Saccharothrix syringae]